MNGYTSACSAVSNATAGNVINPVQSARLTTRFSGSIKFGRVEVRAKMPAGWVVCFSLLLSVLADERLIYSDWVCGSSVRAAVVD